MRAEEAVRFHFFQRLRNAFLAEGTSDLLERVKCWVVAGLDEVDVAEA